VLAFCPGDALSKQLKIAPKRRINQAFSALFYLIHPSANLKMDQLAKMKGLLGINKPASNTKITILCP
jgi:hypothetical protein